MVPAIHAAERLVDAAYLLAELLGGEDQAREWLRRLDTAGGFRAARPRNLSADNQQLFAEELSSAGLLHGDVVDEYRVDELDQVFQLIPHIRAAEQARIPDPVSALVCTVPPQVDLPVRLRPLARSLQTLVADALRSAEDGRVLLASPYWSPDGCGRLRPAMQRALDLGLPVVLAGARRNDPLHFAAMAAFAGELRADGFKVRCLHFLPPLPESICHAKLVCGRTGYLGSGNLTVAGLERHVEVGLPLGPQDVQRAWWLIDLLVDARFLADI
ncbi:phospholipase D-like domain-containing protein [Patulibacter sp. S7RM1-6]